jgi:mono/diheme cytochrome c family protein
VLVCLFIKQPYNKDIVRSEGNMNLWSANRFTSVLKITVLFLLTALAYQNCGKPMSSTSSSNSALSNQAIEQVEQGKTLYLTNCAGCHGPYDTSTKLGRTEAQINFAIDSISQMSQLSGLTAVQVRNISRALVFQANGGSAVVNQAQRLVFSCTPGTRSKTAMQKLNNREFRNTISAILDIVNTGLKSDAQLVDLFSRLPSDIVLESDHTRKEQSFFINQNVVASSFDVAFRAASLMANSSNLSTFPNTNGCLGQGTITSACQQSLVRELGAIAFRRPLTSTEVTSIASRFWDASLSKVNLLEMTITGLLQSPDFLYKVYDRGQQAAGATNILQLTAYEVAAKLSYFLTGTPPDSTLRNLAASGEILNNTVLDQQIERLLSTPRSREVMVRLFRESYGYDIFGNFSYPSFYLEGINTNGLQAAMIDELDQYFPNEVLAQNATFSQLMTSRSAQISNSSLAQIYGSSTGSVQLPSERSGFLNRAAMLTKRTGVRASPIKRGLVVLENVLCSSVGLPPPNAPTALPDLGTGLLSTRELTHRVTEMAGSACVTCHGRLNPLGYAFESFDSLGRVRSVESIYDVNNTLLGQVPVATQADSTDLGIQSVRYSNSTELANEIGRSDKAMLCFAKHLKSFEARRPADASDNCHMNDIVTTLHGANQNQGSIKSAIKNFIMSEQFKYWNF